MQPNAEEEEEDEGEELVVHQIVGASLELSGSSEATTFSYAHVVERQGESAQKKEIACDLKRDD
jgi:hypothetical protein